MSIKNLSTILVSADQGELDPPYGLRQLQIYIPYWSTSDQFLDTDGICRMVDIDPSGLDMFQ